MGLLEQQLNAYTTEKLLEEVKLAADKWISAQDRAKEAGLYSYLKREPAILGENCNSKSGKGK